LSAEKIVGAEKVVGLMEGAKFENEGLTEQPPRKKRGGGSLETQGKESEAKKG